MFVCNIYELFKALSDSIVKPLRLCHELHASLDRIVLMMTTLASHGLHSTLGLHAYAVAFLSCWTCFILIFLVTETSAMSVFLAYFFDVWSLRLSTYFKTSPLHPRTIYLRVMVRLFFFWLPCFRFTLRDAIFFDC